MIQFNDYSQGYTKLSVMVREIYEVIERTVGQGNGMDSFVVGTVGDYIQIFSK